MTGLFTKGDGLSCEDVYLSIDDDKIQRTTFTYGEKFFLNFSDMSGFKKNGETVFPGMSLYVTGASGDTAMEAEDLYVNNADGFTVSPLLLTTYLTVASPIHSGKEYTLFVDIWDKKGKGTFSAKLDFDVIPNPQIHVESNVSYDEIYLFSRKDNKVVLDNTVVSGEDIFMLFEGLSGFAADNNTIYPGLGVQVKDETGAIIMDYADLFEEHSETGIPVSDFTEMVSARLSFPEGMSEKTMQCAITVWDKKGSGKVKATTSLTLKE